MRLSKPIPRAKSASIVVISGFLGLALTACTAAATPTAVPAKPTTAAPTVAPASSPVVASSPAAVASPSPVAATAAATGPATVKVAQMAPRGAIMTDAAGRALYMFTTDKDKTSACYDNCERVWPPLLTLGAPVAGDGATASKLSTTTRRDSSLQVVYGDFPLYYYTPDTAPGDTKGQGVGSVWFVLSASGDPIK